MNEKQIERLNSILLKIYSLQDTSSDEIYEMLICEPGNSQINSSYGELLNKLSLYLFYKNSSLQRLTKHVLPFEIENGLPFDKFCETFDRYKLYVFKESVISGDTYYNLLERALVLRNRVKENSSWKQFDKEDLEDLSVSQEDNYSYKIYLPIANESLELFAMRFLAKCSGRNINYHFKINNDSSLSRSDNVVIYASDNNYDDYIRTIEDILSMDRRIKINYGQQHLLALPYNEYISVAPYTDSDGESFSSIVCNEIYELYKKKTSFDAFYDCVIKILDYYKSKRNKNDKK